MSALAAEDIEALIRQINSEHDQTGTSAGLQDISGTEGPQEGGRPAGPPVKNPDCETSVVEGASDGTTQTGTLGDLQEGTGDPQEATRPADPPVTPPVSRHTAEVEAIIAELTPGWHPIAMAWPTLGPATLKLLCDHLRTHGLIYPIIRYDGLVLAGRNRQIGCQITGITPRYEDYPGDDPVGFAIGENEARRQTLSESQRAMVAARLSNLAHGQKASSDVRPADPPVTQAAAAKSQGVGERTTRAARKILTKAPKLAAAVDAGKLSVDAGEKLADEPVAVQEAVAEQLDQGVDANTAIKRVVPELKTKESKSKPVRKAKPAKVSDIVETTAQLYMSWTPAQRQRFHDRLGELEKIEAQAQPLS